MRIVEVVFLDYGMVNLEKIDRWKHMVMFLQQNEVLCMDNTH